MELKMQRTKGGVELLGSVPPEIANASSLEIFPLRDGMYILALNGFAGNAAPLQQAAPAPGNRLSEAERQLVKKLSAIRFDRRTPGEVDKSLLPKEREILAGLVKKKLVWVYRSEKYGDGVYNVSDAAYGEARDIQPAGAGAQQRANAAAGTGAQAAHDPLANGYLVLENEGDARALSGAVAERIKAGEVSGLRAFDRKYYFIKKAFAEQWQPRLQSALESGDKTAEELSREIGLGVEGCRALLLHMSEGGELLEKSKGKFALA
ncbi:MAG: hypothetical protein WCY41_05120 [Candidatus Micrarchaeia archaeon]